MDRTQIALLKRRHLFQDGWGDLSYAEQVSSELRDPGPVVHIDPVLSEPTRVLGADLRVGEFVSPDPRLPAEVRSVRFWWLHPADQEVRGVIVMPASWGDEGPTMRGRQVGQLVRRGVSVVIMENPFYGCRRRVGQNAGGLRTVSDFILMQGASFIEHRSMVAWLSARVDAPLALAGYSMGGHLASAVAAITPGVPVVAMAPPLAPSEPFAHGRLGVCIDWGALGPHEPSSRTRFMEVMYAFDLRKLQKIRDPGRSRVLGLWQDGMVPRHHARVLANEWDVPFRWVKVGHVGAVISQTGAFRQALLEVLGIPPKTRWPIMSGVVALPVWSSTDR
ncbi:MAG: pimeloyl-ACP methyl ester carboxylesterase [Kiritimatiellia bacterium]|jgi:pimeloyl-ACP methyl ester carboxylesterase